MRRQPLGRSGDQAQLELILSKLTLTTCSAFVLTWSVSWTSTCEPSVLVNVRLKVLCWTSFWLLQDSPNKDAKWPRHPELVASVREVGDVEHVGRRRDRRNARSKRTSPRPVDIPVVNAGGSTGPPGPFEEVSEEPWRASVDANLTAMFLTIKCFLTGMKERG